jgi:hypothetical protein
MHVEAEVLRLEQLKASKMKELVLKKSTKLEELRRQAHHLTVAVCYISYDFSCVEFNSTPTIYGIVRLSKKWFFVLKSQQKVGNRKCIHKS